MAEEIEIKIDIDNLTLGDLETLERWADKETKGIKVKDIVELIDSVLVDFPGGARKIPYRQLHNVAEKIMEAVKTAADPLEEKPA